MKVENHISEQHCLILHCNIFQMKCRERTDVGTVSASHCSIFIVKYSSRNVKQLQPLWWMLLVVVQVPLIVWSCSCGRPLLMMRVLVFPTMIQHIVSFWDCCVVAVTIEDTFANFLSLYCYMDAGVHRNNKPKRHVAQQFWALNVMARTTSANIFFRAAFINFVMLPMLLVAWPVCLRRRAPAKQRAAR